nr:PREDICTED: uncharacterized protein LOC107397669 [Tribolium castaneum]|eukprot:XP_015834059.1 PREDICTED: uncharacterized protein LOC107397669 [Tribolium castaneum]
MIFIEAKNCKIAKFCDAFLILFYSLVQLLDIYYMSKNFSISLLIRYSPITIMYLLIIIAAVISVGLDKEIIEAYTVCCKIRWPMNVVKKQTQIKLKKKCQIINAGLSCTVPLFLVTIISTFPYFGSERDLFICVEVFEAYFGEWSFIPYYFCFAASPFFYYHFFRITFVLVYAFLHAQLQYLLIEEYLFETYETDEAKGWKYLQDTRYQQEIGKSLQLCISQHIALKQFVKKTVDLVLIGMPFFLVFGVLLLTSLLAFITNFEDITSNILKIRILLAAGCSLCITIVFCWIGQQLINVTSDIFFSLGGASWYFWNRDNMKTLLMFLINCTENESVVFAGICLNYELFLSVVRLTVSYTLVLYNLQKQ